jgi:hypothetical protein
MVNKPSPGCNFGNLYRDTDGLTFHTSIESLGAPAPSHSIGSTALPCRGRGRDRFAWSLAMEFGRLRCRRAKPVIIEASTADFLPVV